MRIVLHQLGKRFNRFWIFRKLDYIFEDGNAYAITGANGSGKSTLLQVIAGAVEKSEGETIWTIQSKPIPAENIYQHVTIATPYLELTEELTLKEFLSFHQSFKPFIEGYPVKEIINYIGLSASADKQIRYFSSGMKQRVKLAQAIFSNVPVVMLDEPTTNLDKIGITLYLQMVQDFCQQRLLIVSSNDEQEISFCKDRLDMADYKMVTA